MLPLSSNTHAGSTSSGVTPGSFAEPVPVPLELTGGARAQTVRGYIEVLRRAKVDPRIDSVLIIPTPVQSPYWGKVQEIRDAIVDFKTSEKPIVGFLEYGGEQEFYLASACDKVFLMPTASLDLNGIATYELFLRGALDKIGAWAITEPDSGSVNAPAHIWPDASPGRYASFCALNFSSR